MTAFRLDEIIAGPVCCWRVLSEGSLALPTARRHTRSCRRAINYSSANLHDSEFTLVDIRCAWAIEPVYRSFATALAVDGNVADTRSYRRAQTDVACSMHEGTP